MATPEHYLLHRRTRRRALLATTHVSSLHSRTDRNLIGLGHSVLAMSGEETMAQVYREIEHPKLPNLKKAALVIFMYSLVFTAGVAFFSVMIIPDSVRGSFQGNPIGGLAMYLVGPLSVKLVFRAFVVVVGVLMLAGAVNTVSWAQMAC